MNYELCPPIPTTPAQPPPHPRLTLTYDSNGSPPARTMPSESDFIAKQ
ncbi:MAG: hypothetical protein LBQ31_10570 [Bacteroidales bacterium]|nr:hypothetical protein [Bacteroidales bacterium]